MAPSIKLTYFDIEGKAEPTRLALVLSGTPFEDDRVAFSQWNDLKPTTPYGQLPLLTIDGGPPRTQSGAMLRWVGAKCGDGSLYPSDKLYDVEEAIGLVEDMQQSWAPNLSVGMNPAKFGYPADFGKTDEGKALVTSMREKWISEELPKYLGFFTDMLTKSGGKWLVAGDSPTIADCLAIPTLRSFTRGHIDHVDTRCLDGHPKIVTYVKEFCGLPEIKGRYQNGLGSSNY